MIDVSIRFEAPPGTPHDSLLFDRLQQIRVTGSVQDYLGIPKLFAPVSLTITGDFASIYVESRTNITGNYWFDIQLPGVAGLVVVSVTATHPIFGPVTRSVTIGIEEIPPEPPPPDPGFDLSSIISMIVMLLMMKLMMEMMDDDFLGKTKEKAVTVGKTAVSAATKLKVPKIGK